MEGGRRGRGGREGIGWRGLERRSRRGMEVGIEGREEGEKVG